MTVDGSLIRRCSFSQASNSVYQNPTLTSFLKHNEEIRSPDLHLSKLQNMLHPTRCHWRSEKRVGIFFHFPRPSHFFFVWKKAVSTPSPPSVDNNYIRDCHAPVYTGTRPSVLFFFSSSIKIYKLGNINRLQGILDIRYLPVNLIRFSFYQFSLEGWCGESRLFLFWSTCE